MARNCPKCGLAVGEGATTCGHCNALMPSDFVGAPSGASIPVLSSRWEILAAVEGVGMPRTYLARNKSSEDRACLRMLPASLAEDDPTRERILEAITKERALAGTPSLVAVTGMEVEDRHAWFVTEPFDGTSLQERLKKEKKLPLDECLRIGAAAAEALADAHGKGVAHGELRPSSILLGTEGEVRVTDFLVARIVTEHSLAQMGAGPPKSTFYKSPEFVKNDLPDVRSDLYALGCVLYEAALGERRFPDAYNDTLREPRKGGLFPDPFDGRPLQDERFMDVVRKLVAPAAEDRFEDGRSAAAAMRGGEFTPVRTLSGGAAAIPGGTLAGPRTGRLEKTRGFPLVGVIAGVVIVAGFGWGASVIFSPGSELTPDPEAEPAPPPPVFIPAAPVFTDLPPPPESPGPSVKLPPKFEARDGRIWSQVDGAEMVLIPGGEFLMGGADDEADDTRPRRKVFVSPFLMDRHEVTVAQFQRFCAASKREMPPQPEGSTTRHPVVNVTWTEANAFAAWASKRLPTEAEWEKAARGSSGNPFPWGKEDDPKARNGPGAADGQEGLSVAGTFPEGASPFGCLDMMGNVWEWCADRYGADAYATGPAKDPTGAAAGRDRVVRGGSHLLGGPPLRASFRNRAEPGFRFEDIGFRCAVSVE